MQTASARAVSPTFSSASASSNSSWCLRRRSAPAPATARSSHSSDFGHVVAIAVQPGDQPRGAEAQLRRARRLLERLDRAVDVAGRAQRQAALVFLLRIVEPRALRRLRPHVAEDAVEIGLFGFRGRRGRRRRRRFLIVSRRARSTSTSSDLGVHRRRRRRRRSRRECCRDRSRWRSSRTGDPRRRGAAAA